MTVGGLVAVCTIWLEYMTVGGLVAVCTVCFRYMRVVDRMYSLVKVHDVWWLCGCMYSLFTVHYG